MTKAGYYTVNLEIDGQKFPYIVLAESEYQAAHLVCERTGHMARDYQVEGPYQRS